MQNFCIFLNKFPQFAGKRSTGNLRLMHSPWTGAQASQHICHGVVMVSFELKEFECSKACLHHTICATHVKMKTDTTFLLIL